jgi:MFS transporter, FHS family, glucose/mannose:H+ symporter
MSTICFSMPFLNYYWMLKVYLIFIGMTLVVLKIGIYSSVGLVTSDRKGHAYMITIMEASWMVLSMLGMWILSFFISKSPEHWLYAFWVFGIIGMINFLVWFLAPLDESETKKTKDEGIKKQLKELVALSKKKIILALILVFFLGSFVEQGIFAWLPNFYKDIVNLPSSISIQLASFLTLSMALGRFLIAFLLKFMKWDKIMICCYGLGAVFLIIILFSMHHSNEAIKLWGDIPIAVLLLPLVGLFIAPTSPLLNSTILSSSPKGQHTFIMTILTIAGAVTGSIAARLLGDLFQYFGGITAFRIATIIPLIILVIIILPYSKALEKYKNKWMEQENQN